MIKVLLIPIRDQLNDLLGLNTDQNHQKNTSQWRINLLIQKIAIVLVLVKYQQKLKMMNLKDAYE